MANARLQAELWIGFPAWPDDCNDKELQNSNGVAVCTDFQIGGVFCHHRKFFGLRFAVPKTDPLALLGESYESTNHPGLGNPEICTPLDEVLTLQGRLEGLGLELDAHHYPEFAEAYIPISGGSAWQYVKSKQLMIYKPPSEQHIEATTIPAYVGLGETWEEVGKFIRASWEQCGGYPWFLSGDPWTAVLHYPNSD